jgi:hypothetical protein
MREICREEVASGRSLMHSFSSLCLFPCLAQSDPSSHLDRSKSRSISPKA